MVSVPVHERQGLLGFRPSPPDPRDFVFAASVDVRRTALVLPEYIYPYSPTMPVYDQVGPSCVGNSRSLSSTIDQRRDLHRTLVYDGEELYFACKKDDGIPNVEGTFPRVALKIQQDRGSLVKRSTLATDVGKLHKIQMYTALHTLKEIKVAIYLYRSVTLGSTWYEEWFDVDPLTLIMAKPVHAAGGHAYTAIGWHNKKGLLIQNSWANQFGGKIGGTLGRAWMPFEYLDWADFEAWRSIDVEQ